MPQNNYIRIIHIALIFDILVVFFSLLLTSNELHKLLNAAQTKSVLCGFYNSI